MKTKLALIITLAGCFLCGNIFAAPPLPGAIFTTDSTCTGVNVNIFGSKDAVYLNGGPSHIGAASLPDGSYYVRVTDPSGTPVLGTSIGSGNDTPFVVSGGVANCIQLSAVLIKGSDATPGYDDTTNQGGEYKVWVSTVNTFDNNSTKTDNFKVKENPVVATLCIDKFYDANANGIKDNGEVSINGWQFTIVADANQINTRFTSPLCMVTEAGLYHIFESDAIETNWLHTTPITTDAAIPLTPNLPVEFGNVCLGAGGGLTLGFWSNKNGQNLENAADFTFLTGLCLRTAGGSNQDFNGNLTQNKSALHDWLLNASATNMANMLSAQLAAMELNVRHPGVTGTRLVYGGDCVKAYQQSQQLPGSNGFITINDLMTAANTELCLHGTTLSGSPFRAFQECMKTTLDQANNNINFVQGSPCPFSFAGVAP
ncbi:MAG: hypothetical protein DMF42_01035 [Verrucomicrobia bacterium]|nr:MAG: hypothetical protein DME74_01865 [Verrucomicrobiota bacterium]PYL44470.1 MAG: hypothetical protein DMF42_01035 [Verrucomicrobiota bacterium]